MSVSKRLAEVREKLLETYLETLRRRTRDDDDGDERSRGECRDERHGAREDVLPWHESLEGR